MLLTKFAYPSHSCTKTFHYLYMMVCGYINYYRKTRGVPAVWQQHSNSRQGARMQAYAIAIPVGHHQYQCNFLQYINK
jgi:hypothetical protein